MRKKKGLTFDRVFSKGNPYLETHWGFRNIELKSETSVVFRQDGVEAPAEWSDRAVMIAASKYFRGHAGQPGREKSIKQLFERVVDTISQKGIELGYFDKANGKIFNTELKKLLIEQRLAFNSPVFFNVGLEAKPQCSACFVLAVEDNLESIAELQSAETKLFSMGSGSGTNLSTLRGAGEKLSRGGWASGPLSFLKAYDSWAGIIRSGGVLRRASKFMRLDDDHQDVFNGKEDGSDFISFKASEEKKAIALFDAGLTAGDAYGTVSGQNCNLSVGISNAFMKAAMEGGEWILKSRAGSTAKKVKAAEMLDSLAHNIWECGDPGVQFDDKINEWNSCPKYGKIVSSNPCQPGWARVLTPDGIRTFGTIDVGSTIWSGKRWTKVTKKVATGCKPVFGFMTRAGTFYGTKDHRIVQNGSKVRADVAETIDITSCGMANLDTNEYKVSAQDVMDGLVFGDGMVHKASVSLPPVLCVGENDHDYFDSEVAHLFEKSREGLSRFAWLVTTTISREECPRTYERTVPDRFLFGKPMTVRGFLRGLYSANGSVVSSRVTLKASSRQVVEAVQMMLSVLGIKSYYTINKEHDVEFSNGIYTCKESYDVNISTDRSAFRDLIGFIQKDKQKRLDEACKRPLNGKAKTSYEIVEVASFGRMNVFDITVDDPEHTYWTDGLLVSNCGEFLPPGEGACNLLSINLSKFFGSPESCFFTKEFLHAVRLAIVAQDILVDLSSYPLPRLDTAAKQLRPLGLGFANLGGLLMSLGIPYDSDNGRKLASALTALMTGQAFTTSMELAKMLGPFPEFERNKKHVIAVLRKHKSALDNLQASDSISPMTETIIEDAHSIWTNLMSKSQDMILRNSQVTLMAPTGTIGVMMDSDTGGVEPAMMLSVNKHLTGGGTIKLTIGAVKPALEALGYADIDKIIKKITETGTAEGSGVLDKDLPVFDAAYPIQGRTRCLSAMAHLSMLAAIQPFISGGISKTIGQPNTVSAQEIKDIIVAAWKMGIKSVTIFREGSKIFEPLGGQKAIAKKPRQGREKLPFTVPSIRHKFEISGVEGYLHTGFSDEGRPLELFITIAKEGSTLRGLMDAFATAISIALQYHVPLSVFVEKFKNTKFEPWGLTSNPDVRVCSSIIDYVFRYLAKYDPDSREEVDAVTSGEEKKIARTERKTSAIPTYNMCPVCGSILVRLGNCVYCPQGCPGIGSGTCGG